jgi:hypothetical protein
MGSVIYNTVILVHCFINTLTYYLGLNTGLGYGIVGAGASSCPEQALTPFGCRPPNWHNSKSVPANYTLPYFQVQRAKMILLAADGLSNDQIAARLDTRREVVCFWRKRFSAERLAGLEERSRPGRPRTFSP